MPRNLLRKNCLRCKKVFHTYEEGLVYCNTDCEIKERYEKHFRIEKEVCTKACEHCGLEINAVNRYCNRECSNAAKRLQTKQQRIEKNKTQVKKKSGKALSYYELIRRSEYNRVYNHFDTRRQIEGKARDLI